jgi:predicted outer membrane protein
MRILLVAATVLSAIAAIPASAAGPTSAWDKEWLKTSIAGDRFEIMGGKLALQKSSNPAVDRLAHRLVSDHSKSLQESIALAHRIGVQPPKDPQPSMLWELKMVSALSGRNFDYWYSNLEVYDHSQDINEAKSEAGEGTNQQVRSSAQKELPMLRLHLSLAKHALLASNA